MTLRLKINSIVGALTLLFVGAVLALELHNMRQSVQEEVVAANKVAAQLLNRTAWLYAAQGTAALQGYLQGLGRVRANDITLLDARGQELYRSPPSPYKAGRDAPPWFEALIAPPPSVQSIDFPDGRLVVRANASRAALDAWDEVVWLAGAALALIVIVNVLVFWLVGRAARPFSDIVAALEHLQAGRLEARLPPLAGTEAAAIGAAFNRMVPELRERIEAERRAVRAETELSASRELTQWIDHHLEQERHMIARELHDELGQSVTAIRSMALSIAQRAGDGQTEQAARLIADESSRLYDAMHGIIPRLTPLALDSLGLADALHDLAERMRRSRPDLRVDVDVDLAAAELPSEVALALYRAAQEGITNALRHGQAQHLSLRLTGSATEVSLALVDDGSGLSAAAPAPGGHHGLRWLAERVHALRGRVRVEPASPRGVQLHVSVPLAAAAADAGA